ncbi:MAG: hypothetical protein JSS51_03550 [Planctomycetes bacterium]|nr:hypothetical protein [Planctomycetota bacterium]
MPTISDTSVLRLITGAIESAVANKGDGVSVIHFGEALPDDCTLAVAVAQLGPLSTEDKQNTDGPDRCAGMLAIECVADIENVKDSVYALAGLVDKVIAGVDQKQLTGENHQVLMHRTTRTYMSPPPSVPRQLRVCRIETRLQISRT